MKTHIIHDDFLSSQNHKKSWWSFFQTIAKVAPRWNKRVLYKVGIPQRYGDPIPGTKASAWLGQSFSYVLKTSFQDLDFWGLVSNSWAFLLFHYRFFSTCWWLFSLVSFVFVWGWIMIGWNQPCPGMGPRSVQYDPVEACFEWGGWTRFKKHSMNMWMMKHLGCLKQQMLHTSGMDKARAQNVHTVSTGITSQNGGGGGGFQP